jgi:hypothetical protein
MLERRLGPAVERKLRVRDHKRGGVDHCSSRDALAKMTLFVMSPDRVLVRLTSPRREPNSERYVKIDSGKRKCTCANDRQAVSRSKEDDCSASVRDTRRQVELAKLKTDCSHQLKQKFN